MEKIRELLQNPNTELVSTAYKQRIAEVTQDAVIVQAQLQEVVAYAFTLEKTTKELEQKVDELEKQLEEYKNPKPRNK